MVVVVVVALESWRKVDFRRRSRDARFGMEEGGFKVFCFPEREGLCFSTLTLSLSLCPTNPPTRTNTCICGLKMFILRPIIFLTLVMSVSSLLYYIVVGFSCYIPADNTTMPFPARKSILDLMSATACW